VAFVKRYVISNVESVCNAFVKFILKNMSLRIERINNYYITTSRLLTLYVKKGLNDKLRHEHVKS
jgi:hypothetical protein